MMSKIPEKVVEEEILCRVPAPSLKLLRSTCKHWNRLFNDRKFTRKHFDKATKQFPAFVLTQEHKLCSLSVNLHNGIPSAEVTGELSLNQVRIDDVFHCDGLLLCTIKGNMRSIVVWNPCTGQTKWIQISCHETNDKFVLGTYQDNKSYNKSYKILSYRCYRRWGKPFNIYDINSNSWRKLDVTPTILDYMCSESAVSLKGKTYWFVWPCDLHKSPAGLISFDYTTERSERLPLPYQCDTFKSYSLSRVGEEKLLVLLQNSYSSRSEVWITNKIDDDTNEMSWSKLLEVDVGAGRDNWYVERFLVEEEKKIVVCCEIDYYKHKPVITVFNVDSNPVTFLCEFIILSCILKSNELILLNVLTYLTFNT